MVLFALSMVLVVVMACITVSIAVRTRERLEQQTLSDTIAYSNAVAAARAYNTISLLNRTAIAHWVSLMAVQANVAWSSLHKSWFESLAAGLDSIDPPGAPAPGCATQRQLELRHAKHSLMHAALSTYNAPGAYAADDVDLGRDHPAGPCSLMNERSANWRGRNFGDEDRNVALESRRIYEAINDLTDIQHDVYRQLEQRVKTPQIASSLVRLSRGDNTLGPYRVLDGAPASDGPAWDNVSHAIGRGPADDDRVRKTSLQPLAHAALGSRPSGFLVGGADESPANSNRLTNRAKPPWTLSITDDIAADLNNHFGAGRFRFEVEHFAVRTYLGENADDRFPGLARVHAGRKLGFGNVAGNSWARIRIEYRGPCGTLHQRWVWAVADMMLNRVGTSAHEFGYVTASRDVGLPSAYDNGHVRPLITEGTHGGAPYDLHGGHRHWGELNAGNHYLPGSNDESIWPRGFGFVFPQGPAQEARFPLYGQPRMPVLLARSYRPGDVAPDPWNLTVGLRFSSSGGGATFDMTAGRLSPDQAAMSTAILYYHRRRPPSAGAGDGDRVGRNTTPPSANGWLESPNLLNPYWHATLVRSDLGDRATPTNPPGHPINQRPQYRMLRDEGFTRAAEAYRELESAGFKSWQ